MNTPRTRRQFLSAVGQGMLVATVGSELACEMGFSTAFAGEGDEALSFGALEPLVVLMQETPIERLLPTLVERIKGGTNLETLMAAGALANARTFGGEDYIGFHTMMAMSPAIHMAKQLPEERRALPVLKVLYRNTNRIAEHGGRSSEVLKRVAPASLSASQLTGEELRAAVRAKDVNRAEQTFAASANGSINDAFNDLLFAVEDATEVHRVVMPYRAYDLLKLIGPEQAHTMLRQSVRYCVQAESRNGPTYSDEPRALLPKLFDQYHLLDLKPGSRPADDDAWVDVFSQMLFRATPEEAANLAASTLANGFDPAAIGEAISLSANQLVLRDAGRTARDESPGKPIGSVHGDSIGVHACDSANAWRNMAKVGNPRNVFACVILGAYQVALDRLNRGGDFANWDPQPIARQLERVKATDADELLGDLDEAIRGNLQARACAVTHRYGELKHPPHKVFDLLLGYAVSEDGALHAEKYFRTVQEEFSASRLAFRWRHLTALARVTASEYGRRAAGYEEARELLKV